jgi:Kdo2-lipid IVA lauroyltransferase/acyltransferase
MKSSKFRQWRKKHLKHNRVLNYLGYLALRGFVGFLLILGLDRSLRLAKGAGTLLWKHSKRHRQRALDNLRAAFPEKEHQWHIDTGIKSFQNLAMMVVDIIYTPRLVKKGNWREFSRFINAERVKWIVKEHKGAVLLTPHYGNFEITGYMFGLYGFDLYSIARPLDNPYISRWLYGIREEKGQKIIDKKGASEHMHDILGSGATLGFIADQDAGRKGVFVDFFGRKASTYKSIGLVAMEYNVPIVVGVSRRVGERFFFEMECGRIIEPHEWKDREKPLEWITQEFSSEMERLIRKAPEQYWWIHRRWKTPPGRKRKRVE